ncbi:MAG: hypothetical protein Q9161_001350 [Pseudevernia consocians]
MSESTFHMTGEDLRKPESQVSKKNNGNVPADSESIIDQNSKPKSEIIAERQSNLPLPDDPPVASDWNSSDGSKVNVGSGGVEGDISYGGDIREPATSDSSVRTDGETFNKNSSQPQGVGREGHDGLDGVPKDALKK